MRRTNVTKSATWSLATLTGLALSIVALSSAVGVALAQDVANVPPGMTPHTDPKGLISIDLPRGTTEVGTDAKDPLSMQRWGLNWNEKPGEPYAHLYLKHVPGYARAPLCGWVRGPSRNGDRVESSVTINEDDYFETREYQGTARLRFRVIEHAGQCFEAYILVRNALFDRLVPQADLLLATMKGSAAPAPLVPPDGFKASEVSGLVVWSNVKKKREMQRIAKLHKKAWDTMAKGLPGERYDATPPLLIVCDDDASYASFWSSKKGAPKASFNDVKTRAVVVRVVKRRDPEYEQSIHRAVCLQYVRSFFGGPTPAWIEDGLRMYGAQSVVANGKFDQPFTKSIKTAREAAKRRNATLLEIFELGKADPVDRNNRDYELYAWHWFFRHGPGQEKYGDLYERHLASLREHGNVPEARKVWDSANADDLRSEFQAWIAKWRE